MMLSVTLYSEALLLKLFAQWSDAVGFDVGWQ